MVTINPDKTMIKIPAAGQPGNEASVKPGQFNAVFKKAIDASSADAKPEAESMPLVSALRPAQFEADPMPSTPKVIEQVNSLIDTMADYQEKLGDQDIALRTIQPLVEKLVSQNEALAKMSSRVEAQTELKTIIDGALTLSSAEIAKFNGGHYNHG